MGHVGHVLLLSREKLQMRSVNFLATYKEEQKFMV